MGFQNGIKQPLPQVVKEKLKGARIMELLKLYAVHLGVWCFLFLLWGVEEDEKIPQFLVNNVFVASMSFAIHWGLS